MVFKKKETEQYVPGKSDVSPEDVYSKPQEEPVRDTGILKALYPSDLPMHTFESICGVYVEGLREVVIQKSMSNRFKRLGWKVVKAQILSKTLEDGTQVKYTSL